MKRYLIGLFILFIQQIAFAQVLGTPLYSWDFANGIPSNFENASASGIGIWEYRGMSTVPNNTVCSRGSCGSVSVPITSTTLSNGFVIFDSNYWDDNDTQCGGLGTGQDPAPHTAWLTTPSFSLQGFTGAVLTFQQQYRIFNATSKVQISTNGGTTWTDIITNTEYNSPTSEWDTFNLSAYMGQTNVKIRFYFTGTYYHWCLDDITIYQPNQNDIAISNAKYTQANQGLNGLGEDLEYDQYPQIMLPPFNFSAVTTNIGSNIQNSVQMTARIFNGGGTLIHSQASTSPNLNPGSAITQTAGGAWTPNSTLGDYTMTFTSQQTQTDQNNANNVITKTYSITPYSYARDEGPMEDIFTPAASYLGQIHQVGNFYQARANNLQFHSIAVAVGTGTTPGTVIKGTVYYSDIDSVLAETVPYTVNAADINAVGQEKLITLPLTTPMTLMNDSLYVVMVGTVDGSQTLRVCRSGPSPEQTSYVKYPDVNGLFFLLKTPIVRMNIFPLSENPGCTDPLAMNYEPGATVSDGSCDYPGCTNPEADNYSPSANFDDGTCLTFGCTNPNADNYDFLATVDDGSCIFSGCTDPEADNFDPQANFEDGTCIYFGCTSMEAINFDPSANTDDGSCLFLGCTDPDADNFDPTANLDDGSCIFYGCTYPEAINFDPQANTNDGSCIVFGCMDPEADNYLSIATDDDGSCFYLGCTDPEADNYDPTATVDDGGCIYYGCTDPWANNYDPEANTNDLSCLYNIAAIDIAEALTGCAPYTVTVINQTVVAEGGACQFSVEGMLNIDECVSSFDITFDIPGEYYVVYTYTQGDNSTTDTVGPIIVNESPALPTLNSTFGFVACDNCSGNNLEWFVDDALFSSSDEIALSTWNGVTYENGSYHITSTNEFGCSQTSAPLMVVQPYFDANVFEGCDPLNVTLTHLTDPIIGLSCEYIIDGMDYDPVALSDFTFNTSGLQTITIACSLNDIDYSYTREFEVFETITPIIVQEATGFSCTNCAGQTTTWVIDQDMVFSNIDFIEFAGTDYQVSITTENGCISDTTFTYIGIEDLTNAIRIYPNPVNSELIVKTSNAFDAYAVIDVQGKMVLQDQMLGLVKVIDVNQLTPGSYTLMLKKGTEFENMKFVVER